MSFDKGPMYFGHSVLLGRCVLGRDMMNNLNITNM